MNTFSSVLPLLRLLPRPTSRQASIFPSLVRLLCVERKGALVCCMPGAPIVRLPH
ncbi:hypothetical protein [Pseudomonas chlororaphis]|uniref:hypothetical protein n=1 Tax=Pseudomonas chlororaphis TaxID=587753 RepID=UPI000B318C00|nr:hypothetical protein [Pseudomonas chlororaphis]